MAISRIFLWLGYSLCLIALLMFLTSLLGFMMGDVVDAQAFLASGCLIGITGLIVGISAQNAPVREGARELLIFLLLFWFLVPLFAALPLRVSRTVSSMGIAYFETVSAVTTTGASTLDADSLSNTILLWRSLLQWSGGCIVATFAVVVLAALNLSGTGVHRSVLFTMKKGELFSRLLHVFKVIAMIYFGFAFVSAILLNLTGTPIFEAACLGLSAVSTGGLTPRSGPLVGYVSGLGAIFLALTCLLGAVNVSIFSEIFRRRSLSSLKAGLANVELRGTLGMIGFLLVVGFIFAGTMNLHTVLVEAVFMVTTAGYDYHIIGIDILPPAILIALVLVGGSALSTAGGLKIIRMLLLLRHTRTDLDRMSHPSRVRPVRFQGKTIDDAAFLSIWMYFFGYTVIFALGIVALGAGGLEFTTAVSASAAALSNTGPLLSATNADTTYAEMNQLLLHILSVIMIFGRIEVLAVLAALSPSLWRR